MSAQVENILYFLLFAGLFVVMMRFGCGAHVMGHGHHRGAKSSDDQASDSNVRLVPPDRAVDPVCGMTVQTAGLVHSFDLWASLQLLRDALTPGP